MSVRLVIFASLMLFSSIFVLAMPNGEMDDALKEEKAVKVNIQINFEKVKRTRRFVPSGEKWDKLEITWRLMNETLPNLDVFQVRKVLREAAAQWSQVSRLTLDEWNSTDADIQIRFIKENEDNNCSPHWPVCVYLPGSGGDINFSIERPWVYSGIPAKAGDRKLLNVALYGFGVALGLRNSNVTGSVLTSDINVTELHADDEEGFQYLYGKKTTPSTTTAAATTKQSPTEGKTLKTTTIPSSTATPPVAQNCADQLVFNYILLAIVVFLLFVLIVAASKIKQTHARSKCSDELAELQKYSPEND